MRRNLIKKLMLPGLLTLAITAASECGSSPVNRVATESEGSLSVQARSSVTAAAGKSAAIRSPLPAPCTVLDRWTLKEVSDTDTDTVALQSELSFWLRVSTLDLEY